MASPGTAAGSSSGSLWTCRSAPGRSACRSRPRRTGKIAYARELAELIAAAYPNGTIDVVGDAAYVGEHLRGLDPEGAARREERSGKRVDAIMGLKTL